MSLGFSANRQPTDSSWRVAGRWLGLLLVACASSGNGGASSSQGPDAGGGFDAASRVRLVLGSGEARFEPVHEGQVVRVVAGPQGGFHVPLSLRLYGTDSERWLMRVATQWDGVEGTEVPAPANSDGLQPGDIAIRLRPVLDDQGASTLELLNWTAFLFRPQCADGQRLEVSVQLFPRPVAGADSGRQQLAAQGRAVWSLAVDEAYQATDCAVEAGRSQ